MITKSNSNAANGKRQWNCWQIFDFIFGFYLSISSAKVVIEHQWKFVNYYSSADFVLWRNLEIIFIFIMCFVTLKFTQSKNMITALAMARRCKIGLKFPRVTVQFPTIANSVKCVEMPVFTNCLVLLMTLCSCCLYKKTTHENWT